MWSRDSPAPGTAVTQHQTCALGTGLCKGSRTTPRHNPGLRESLSLALVEDVLDKSELLSSNGDGNEAGWTLRLLQTHVLMAHGQMPQVIRILVDTEGPMPLPAGTVAPSRLGSSSTAAWRVSGEELCLSWLPPALLRAEGAKFTLLGCCGVFWAKIPTCGVG